MESCSSFTSETRIHIALFEGLENANELRQRLLASDATLSFAFIDAAIVVSKLQVLLAAQKALDNEARQTLKTHNVHSEIVFNLSPTTNISESLRRFGISKDTKAMVVVKISQEPTPDIEARLRELVKGHLVPLSGLGQHVDIKRIDKYYKLNGIPHLTADNRVDLVIGAMAVKSIA
ncbi:hypothetical protein BZG36_01649 [Bifiguratus adelaidae]|uniref:EKC/KEOPS complex subunit CGI121 n=1 Tax=Bifiguratus adelaidae TaxID=1938954 RepID=A0A261Y4A4_9FUNG|nr:hypothetical protein BZG36_01649 [Bifiguratus adelaidae]